MASQGSSMELLNNQLPDSTSRDAQPCSLKEKTLLKVKGAVGSLDTFLKCVLEILIFGLQVFYHLKAKYFGSQNRK